MLKTVKIWEFVKSFLKKSLEAWVIFLVEVLALVGFISATSSVYSFPFTGEQITSVICFICILAAARWGLGMLK